MIVQILILTILVLLLIITVIFKMLRLTRPTYPEMYNRGGSGGNDSLFLILLLFFAMIGTVVWMNLPEAGIWDIVKKPAVLEAGVDAYGGFFMQPPTNQSLPPKATENTDPVTSVGSTTTINQVIIYEAPRLTPVSTIRYGFRYKAGSNPRWVSAEVEKLRGRYPDAQMHAVYDKTDSPLKVVLFSAGTKEEVARWVNEHPELKEGAIIHMPTEVIYP